jgi:hypothetical protein
VLQGFKFRYFSDTNFDINLRNNKEYDGLYVLEGNILKENMHYYLRLLFLKRRYQLISRNIRVSSGYVAYRYLVSTAKLGTSFISKLKVSEKVIFFVNKFSSF